LGNQLDRRGGAAHRGQGGFSLVEVTILALLLLVAVGGLSGAVLSSLRLARTTEESALADEAARAVAARLYNTDFADIFYTYNESTVDDVGLPAPVPGAAFDVAGLTPRHDDPDGRVGRLVFPSVDGVGGLQVLREDYVDPRMGMAEGRDLNGDGDALDELTNDYVFLPVRVIIEWTGAGGNRLYELDLMLVQ